LIAARQLRETALKARDRRRGAAPEESMTDGSGKVVYAALAGNVLVALCKYAAAFLSGSSAMLTEAVHSSADCLNQLLLLVGVRRGGLPPDATHQFGYGMEIYFWTFVVAMLVLIVGGAFSLYQGIDKLAAPAPIRSPLVGLAVLFCSALFEGASFAIGYGEYRRIARGAAPRTRVGLVRFIQWSKDPSLYETLLEDGAALAGLSVAALGIVGSAYGGWLPADAIASMGIGLLLLANGVAILVATRSLIAGEAVAPPVLENLERGFRNEPWSDRIRDIATLHLGPNCILVAATLVPSRNGIPDDIIARQLQQRLRKIDPRVVEVLFRLTDSDDASNGVGESTGKRP
jgi:cation diffusion facilitator family transporter